MNLTIRIPEQAVLALQAKARARGLSAEEYALHVLELDLAPDWLRNSWMSAKDAGLNQLTDAQIDAEIAASRRERHGSRS